MTREKQRRTLYLLPALLLAGGQARATYQVNCGGNPFQVHNISSQFGEARPATAGVVDPTRFHGGTDILDDCFAPNEVRPIEAGVLYTTSTACESAIACVRVVAPSGHAFDYEHVLWSSFTVNGQWVTTNTVIGVIQSGAGANHLHLNEIIRIGQTNVRVNTQLPGHLDYSVTDTPDFSTATVSPVIDEPLIFVEHGVSPYPTALRLRNGTFYVRGSVDIFATARVGNSRKGVYRIGTNAYPITLAAPFALPGPATQFSGQNNLAFAQLQDGPSVIEDVTDVYYVRQIDADTYKATSRFIGPNTPQSEYSWWDTETISDGLKNICVYAQDHPQPRENVATQCADAYVDNTAPSTPTFTSAGAPFTIATATPVVTVTATDAGGIYSIKIDNGVSYSSTNYPSGVQTTASNQFPDSSTLPDGSYTVTIQDLAGNVNSNTIFRIDTVSPATPNPQNPSGEELPATFASTNSVVSPGYDADSGICKIVVTGPTSSSTFTFRGTQGTSLAGPVSVSSGNLNITYVDCAGNRSTTNSTVTTGTIGMQICANGGGFTNECGLVQTPNINNAMIESGTLTLTLKSKAVGGCNGSNIAAMCALMVPTCSVITSCYCTDQATIVCAAGGLGGAASIANSASYTSVQGLEASLDLTSPHGNAAVVIQKDSSGGYSLASGASVDLAFSLSNAGQRTTITHAPSGFSFLSYIKNLLIQAVALAENLLQSSRNVVLGPVGTPARLYGSEFLFASTTTVNISTGLPSGVSIDSTTLAIYSYDGSSWSSAPVTNQVLSVNGNTVTATGTIQGSGTYALFFVGTDTTAPISSFSLQGASSTFDQALFVSTDAFVVLSGTDPVINGFASTVASVTYRLDPSSGSPFYIYSSSIPLSLGTHVLEYRSLDYAGNTEAIKTATFTVTVGAAMRGSSTAQVPGVLLNGFLGSGAKLEVESQAQNSLTLLISSVNRQGMVAVDNIGEVGIGVTPQANLNIGQASIGLQLRSGNSTSAVTSNQIAFAYNGDNSMRHLLRTEHNTATHGNKMDFLVWNTGAASTTTLPSLNVLSLQGIATASGGSFHVQPVGEPDAEVEVSNGLSTGGGTMQRLQLVSPSSRRFKTDIKDLRAKDEDRALEDIAGLKHARFRYKTRLKDGRLVEDAAQPLRTGLVYEEAPESIRDGKEALSTTERLVNVEMALKASMRRLEELQKRYETLKARRRNP